MTVEAPSVAPVLSTPDDRIFTAPGANPPPNVQDHSLLGEDAFREMYEIDRTVQEILSKDYKRVALQFPDELLGDSERVYTLVAKGINNFPKSTEIAINERKVFILADTSYSACCVDEIAAEHVAADVLIHYGRSCLSPTTRLPVIYVFTCHPLDLSVAIAGFKQTFPELNSKVLLVADVTYDSHTEPLYTALKAAGYTNICRTEIIHSPSSLIPNRTIPLDMKEEELAEYHLFHISEPLPSLLLVLASRVASIHYFSPTTSKVECSAASPLLRRRYAVLSHARSAGIVGILVNTLNVKNYLPMISSLKQQIRAAGRKSYLVVVGKVNVEKVANFSEVEVWVGVGCWEQGVVGGTDGRGWYRPVITPWELEIALGKSEWTGRWIADFAEVLRLGDEKQDDTNGDENKDEEEEEEDEDEDAPPEFDLRTGRYVSTSRPLGTLRKSKPKVENGDSNNASSQLVATSNKQKELIQNGGVLSPAAQFLKEKRTWQGLGSDYVDEDTKEGESGGALVEEGRSGIARGYRVGEDTGKH